MNISSKSNYVATVTQVTSLQPAAGLNNLSYANFFGYKVLVDSKTPIGNVGLYFPIGTKIAHWLLGGANLYRKPEYGNVNPEASGFFEQHGRVKPVKLRGNSSDGFWIPLAAVVPAILSLDITRHLVKLPIGTDFDTLDGLEFCSKFYVSPRKQFIPGQLDSGQNKKVQDLADRIVGGQFRFHADTKNLLRFYESIPLGSTVSITEKLHGTSAVFANVLVKRNLSLLERIFNWILPGSVKTEEYKPVVSSRKIIKFVGDHFNPAAGYYGQNVWEDAYYENLDGLLPEGYTVYGEIVGYTGSGSPIQQGYSYGCLDYTGQKKLYVYRVTVTSPHGVTLELDINQRLDFCEERGLMHVPVLRQDFPVDHPADINNLVNDAKYYCSALKPMPGDDPPEGVVVRVESSRFFEAYKLKTQEFLNREDKNLDSGVEDVESQESSL